MVVVLSALVMVKAFSASEPSWLSSPVQTAVAVAVPALRLSVYEMDS